MGLGNYHVFVRYVEQRELGLGFAVVERSLMGEIRAVPLGEVFDLDLFLPAVVQPGYRDGFQDALAGGGGGLAALAEFGAFRAERAVRLHGEGRSETLDARLHSRPVHLKSML